MTSELILEAHDDDPDVRLDTLTTEQLDDPMLARSLLIELQRNERKAAQLRATMASVQGTYQARLDALAARERDVRQSLAIYVERNGTASFPDVGSVAIRKNKPTAKVQSDEAFAAWLIARGESALVKADQKYTFKQQARKVANDWLRETGEAPRGCDIAPESTSLVIRKAE